MKEAFHVVGGLFVLLFSTGALLAGTLGGKHFFLDCQALLSLVGLGCFWVQTQGFVSFCHIGHSIPEIEINARDAIEAVLRRYR